MEGGIEGPHGFLPLSSSCLNRNSIHLPSGHHGGLHHPCLKYKVLAVSIMSNQELIFERTSHCLLLLHPSMNKSPHNSCARIEQHGYVVEFIITTGAPGGLHNRFLHITDGARKNLFQRCHMFFPAHNR